MTKTTRTAVLVLFGVALAVASAVDAQVTMSADGSVESRSGGFRFPDGTLQLTAAQYPSAVEKSGRTTCFFANGNPRDCTATGEDGDHQAGIPWPAPRFIDQGDGTILDQLTGLVWLKDANCLGGTATWQAALTWVVVTLNFSPLTSCTDYAALTHRDWRLPNIKELMSLVDYSRWGPALPASHLFTGIQSALYWSSSGDHLAPTAAWFLNVNEGRSQTASKTSSAHVWAVRGGTL